MSQEGHPVRRYALWTLAVALLVLAALLAARAGRRLFDGTSEAVLAVGETRLPDARPLLATVPASADEGFHFPYFLLLPESLDGAEPVRLLVEPNNTGTADDDPQVHSDSALRLALRGHARTLADRLGTPLLVPAFPRPRSDWTIYTHALDRDSMQVEGGELARIDLQLLAMVRHATGVLAASGIAIRPGLWLHGFSASGTFVNRFAALHPEAVRAVASGGVNGMSILPFAELDGTALPYPIGVGDVEALTGAAFDAESYSAVAQRIYMGALDRNDTLPYGDAWNEDEKQLIASLLGENMMPDRWQRTRALLESADGRVECVTYEAANHEITPQMLDDLVAFFRTTDGGAPGS